MRGTSRSISNSSSPSWATWPCWTQTSRRSNSSHRTCLRSSPKCSRCQRKRRLVGPVRHSPRRPLRSLRISHHSNRWDGNATKTARAPHPSRSKPIRSRVTAISRGQVKTNTPTPRKALKRIRPNQNWQVGLFLHLLEEIDFLFSHENCYLSRKQETDQHGPVAIESKTTATATATASVSKSGSHH